MASELTKISDYVIDKIEGEYAFTKKDNLYGLSLLNSKTLYASVIVKPIYKKLKLIDEVIVVCNSAKYGLLDLNGKMILELRYDFIDNSNGTLTFQSLDGAYLINTKGNILFKCSRITEFEGEYAKFYSNDSGMEGFIDSNGKILFQKRCYSLKRINDDYFIFRDHADYNRIKRTKLMIKDFGHMIVDDNYEPISFLSNARYWSNKLYGLVDKTGKEVIPCQYKNMEDLGYNRLLVTNDEKQKIVNYQNKKIAKVKNIDLEKQDNKHNTFCYFDKSYGLMNNDGKKVTDPIYRRIRSCGNGIFIVQHESNNFYEIINYQGKNVCGDLLFKQLKRIAGSIYVTEQGVFSTSKKDYVLKTTEYLDIKYNKKNITFTDKNGTKKLMTLEGDIIDIAYDKIFDFDNDYALVNLNNQYGLIDESGHLLFNLVNDAFKKYEIKDNFVKLKHYDDSFSLIRLNGNPIIYKKECQGLAILNKEVITIDNYLVQINTLIDNLNSINNEQLKKYHLKQMLQDTSNYYLLEYLYSLLDVVDNDKIDEIYNDLSQKKREIKEDEKRRKLY